MCGFAYCFSASAMRGWFSLVKTDVWRAEENFSFGSRDWLSQIQVETFQHQISILSKPNGNFWPEIPTGPVWFWDFRRSVCFDFVIFPDCWISLNWRLVFVWNQISRERIQFFESWEPWSSIKLESTFCLVFVFDSLMAEQQTQNTAIVEEKQVPPTDEVEEGPGFKVESPVPPVAKASTPELTESPQLVAEMTVQLMTAKTETDALLGAIKEISDSLEGVDGQEGTSKLIKVMLLGLKAQRSISQGGYIEMKQIAVKQLDLLRHVASGFSDQTELLQTLSDDIGANLNQLAQSFVKLSDVMKDGYKQSKDGGADTENRHRQMLEKLDSQNVYFLHMRNGINSLVKALTNLQWTAEELRTGSKEGKSGEVSSKGGSLIATVNRNLAEILERYPVDLAALADEITKAVKSLEGMMEKKRPAESPPSVPRTQTGEIPASWNKGGIWGDRSRERSTNGILVGWNSSQEWKCSIESWTANATAGFGPTIGDSHDAYVGWWQHADPRIWISTTTPTGILLWSSSDYVRPTGMTAPHMPAATGPTPWRMLEIFADEWWLTRRFGSVSL